MSITSTTKHKLRGTTELVDTPVEAFNNWERNSDWLSVTAPSAEVGVCLVAVESFGKNYETIYIEGSSGTIDWGDGTTDNYTDSTMVEHDYTYSNISASTQLANGDRQAIVTITATSGTTTRVDFGKQTTKTATNVSTNWLEIHLNFGSCTDYVFDDQFMHHYRVEYIHIYDADDALNLNYTFEDLFALRKVFIPILTGLTGCERAFNNCRNLIDVNSFTLPTSLVGLFAGCISLEQAPEFDTSSVSSFTNMFDGCGSLRTIPHYDTSNGGLFNSMFGNCFSLREIPLLDTSSATEMNGMFQGCRSLQTIPLIDTSNVTLFTLMFGDCKSLNHLPELDFSSNAGASTGVFYNCESLTKLPASFAGFTVTTSMSSFFRDCRSLQEIPNMVTTGVTSFAYCFRNNTSLKEIGTMDLSSVVTTSGVNQLLTNNISLAKFNAIGPDADWNISGGSLWGDELDQIFTNLPTVTGKTITITNTFGAADCDTSIATAKGWTVTN
tara:strand:+ start:395 stop:1885 length:1491 start_codon:yes stop_codon:yes gene_type:complete